MRKTIFYIIPCLLWCGNTLAQKIDNMAMYNDIQSERYFRFSYDNDFFTATDKNYTQGYNIEFVSPFFKKNPINYLFYMPSNSAFKYGLSWEHIGFTPADYSVKEIQYGDRPFASALYLKSFMIATNDARKARYTSSMSLGILGPAAFGEGMQVEIHKATGNVIPQGWLNQIDNHLVINYEAGYEKQLAQIGNYFRLNAQANAQLGTLFTNAAVGANLVTGIINQPYATNANKKFVLYIYAQPLAKAIGHDATLQGGLIGDKSVYKIAAQDLSRLTAQLNYGIVLQTRSLFFSYSQAVQSKEYSFGQYYRWGGVKAGFVF